MQTTRPHHHEAIACYLGIKYTLTKIAGRQLVHTGR